MFCFEYVKLKNFKSFGDVHLNLCDRKGTPRKMIILYGANGSGKTNLASAFYFLSESLNTMDVRDIMQKLITESPEIADNSNILKFFRSQYRDLETLIKEYKTISSEQNMELEFGFSMNGRSGCYIMETNDDQLVHERLEYTITKNRGIYFDITPDEISINAKIFSSRDFHAEIQQLSHKFWGKHSLLSILCHEQHDKADSYITDSITGNFIDIITGFAMIACKINLGSRYESHALNLPYNYLENINTGVISNERIKILENNEMMLKSFFRNTFKNIKDVCYEQEVGKNGIKYQLKLVKTIAGKDREIEYSKESAGTRTLINMLPYLLLSEYGKVSIIDEFELGLHDNLVTNIICSLYSSMQGQIILTSHNTNLMNSDLPKECFFVINVDSTGNTTILPITYYDHKIHKNTNIRNNYLSGVYTGTPDLESIDFTSLLEKLELD